MKTTFIVGVPLLILIVGGGAWLYGQSAPRRVTHPPVPLAMQAPSAASTDPTQIIYNISISPTTLIANQPTTVIVSAALGDNPALLPEGIVINKLTSAGQSSSLLGRMYDDGTHGDTVANDKLFTTTITLSESSSLTLEVSVPYRGRLRRLISRIEIPVFRPSLLTEKQTLTTVADSLDRGDVESALGYMYLTPSQIVALKNLTNAQLLPLAALFRAATFESTVDPYQIYSSGGREISLLRSPKGDWLIISW
ncbi:MAG: hypothetical protein K2X00_17750 [Nitrospiraceae bacterium]|nr:hypothetical protein [Nitrospiraceae bacterium]